MQKKRFFFLLCVYIFFTLIFFIIIFFKLLYFSLGCDCRVTPDNWENPYVWLSVRRTFGAVTVSDVADYVQEPLCIGCAKNNSAT